MPWTEPLQPITVEIDIPITRRLKMHAVVDGNGVQIFHSKRISEVFTWILDNEITDFTMLDGHAEFRVYLRAPLSPNPQVKG